MARRSTAAEGGSDDEQCEGDEHCDDHVTGVGLHERLGANPRVSDRAMTGFEIGRLLHRESFPHPVETLEVVETHVSWVILTGALAYKLKKPVRFDFIDASTLERRRALCEEELRLNRRLAPELYLDVVPIVAEGDRMRIGADGQAIEHAVRMHQFDRAQELSALLAAAAVTRAEIEDLAERLGAFHAGLPDAGATSPYGSYEQVCEGVLANLAGLTRENDDETTARALERITDWIGERIVALRPLVELRKASGWIRECHGDLHARNIVRWQGKLLPFVCLEFAPELRWIDVASELAFLHMDLLGHDRADLAAALLNRYLEQTGDYESMRLLTFYAVHRALVRARIDGLQRRGAEPAHAAELAARSRARIALAGRLTAPADPVLVLMQGTSASGKTWLSSRLVPALGAVRFRSDLERRRLTGFPATGSTHSGLQSGAYAASITDRTYARLVECADAALEGGQNVIVDATLLRAAQRRLFLELAAQRKVRILIVACRADREVLRRRIDARAASGRDASEATHEVLARQLRAMEPLLPHEHTHALEIDTSRLDSADKVLGIVRERVERATRP
jgi:aminoglycoside phosphotransferase family enzyme/predicted kinase